MTTVVCNHNEKIMAKNILILNIGFICRQLSWYHSSYLFGRALALDIFALQTASILLVCAIPCLGSPKCLSIILVCLYNRTPFLMSNNQEGNHFLSTLLDHFDLSDYFIMEQKGCDDSALQAEQIALAEEFLRLVLRVATDRRSISNECSLRRQVIHWIAAGDKITHSKLMKKVGCTSESNERITNKGTRCVCAFLEGRECMVVTRL